ncbi:MAG: SCP2 sterol-binding domain-containing protein [Oscillospiraceae bacterium]|nr:SCP2 sterol-binding domain-containing protein [Oscillospiraceae bacterium]
MSDDVKITTTVKVPANEGGTAGKPVVAEVKKPAPKAAAKKVAKKPAAKAAPKAAAKPAAKAAKAAVKKAEPKVAKKAAPKAAKAAPKAAAKPVAASPVAKATAKKAVAKKDVAKAPVKKGGRKKAEVFVDATDKAKTALWKAISKTKAKKIKGEVAIQVYAEGLDSFYIAVKDGTPEIERYHYDNNAGSLNLTEKELYKIAKGKYDVIAGVKSGAVGFEGNLSVLLKIMDIF